MSSSSNTSCRGWRRCLNVRCVAEGVETAEQMELLQELGCDFAQGYLFCRPTDAAALQEWLETRSQPTSSG